MSQMTLHIKTPRDVAVLKKILDGFEAKGIYIMTKDSYCRWQHLWLLPLVAHHYKPVVIYKYLRCLFKRFHQVFITYNVEKTEKTIIAFIYKPWRVVVRDYGGYVWIYRGSLEKIYSSLKVFLEGYEIQVIPHDL